MTRTRALLLTLTVLAAACSNTDDDPRPVDPPPCYPNCTTRP